ncbi:MAG: radical SAM protein, partial [Acidobacteriota bacterium]
VVREVQALTDGGYREVVVTGVQISEYDDGRHRLFDVASALLERTTAPRIRLTSLAPWRFDDRLIDLWQDPRLCRHIHMSLQSGCTATLSRMRRPYSADEYEALAERLRQRIPGLALTTDVIIGFPGECDEEFEQSLAFVERLAFAKPHLFTYSPRPGTRAARLPNMVEPAVKKERMGRMQAVAAESERAFWRGCVGETVGVVWDGERHGRWTGLTDHYVRVFAEAGPEPVPIGELGLVKVVRVEDRGVTARRLESSTAELVPRAPEMPPRREPEARSPLHVLA